MVVCYPNLRRHYQEDVKALKEMISELRALVMKYGV